MTIRDYFFELTPLGKADKEVKNYLKEGVEPHQFERYHRRMNEYRFVKILQLTFKTLFYAGLITSFAATIGFRGEAMILQTIASYIGTSLLLILYALTSYIAMIRREAYHVQREILVSQGNFN